MIIICDLDISLKQILCDGIDGECAQVINVIESSTPLFIAFVPAPEPTDYPCVYK